MEHCRSSRDLDKNLLSSCRSLMIELCNMWRVIRSYSPDVRVVFYTGESLRKMSVLSSFGRPVCPHKKWRDGGKKRGRPMECQGCDAGFAHGNCVS